MSESSDNSPNGGAEDLTPWQAAAARNKQAVLAALAQAGFTTAIAYFDGYADSGQIDDVSGYKGEDRLPLPEAWVELQEISGGRAPEIKMRRLEDALEDVAWDVLEHFAEGWENNSGAFGDVYFDVAANEVRLKMNSRITEIEYSEHGI